MSRHDPDWEKKLNDRPHSEKGFNDDLRRRIEHRLDRRESRMRKWLWPAACLCGIAGGWALYLYGGLPLLSGSRNGSVQASSVSQPAVQEAQEYGSAPAAAAALREEVNVKSGLLIGLRQDIAPDASATGSRTLSASSYRTLMLATVDGELQVAAQGDGILVPYGQKFWKIDTKDVITASDELHYLYAYPADKKTEPQLVVDNPEENIYLREKLLFAGNQYVSVEEEEIWQSGSLPAEQNRVWVRKLSQLNGTSLSSYNYKENVSVKDIFGEGAEEILARMPYSASSLAGQSGGYPAIGIGVEDSDAFFYPGGENWAITRKPGRWIAQVAEPVYEPEARVIGFKLHPYPVKLPELITSHDKLSDASWVRDAQLQENRKDLLVSPLEDLAVVFTDKRLALYTPDSAAKNGRLVMEVPLKQGEALVSAQWATGSYVGDWVSKTRKYLQNGQE